LEDPTLLANRLKYRNKKLNKLLQKYKQRDQLQIALIQLSELANTVAELTQLYPAIHEILKQHLPSNSFYVVLQNQYTQSLELSYFVDEKDGISVPVQEYYHFSEGVTGFTFKKGETVHINKHDMARLSDEGQFKLLGTPAEHWLGVPIKQNQQIIGVMVTQSYDVLLAYNEHQVDLLEFISLYLGTAIERVKKRELLESEVKTRTRAVMQSNEALNKEIENRKRALDRQQILFKISELATQFTDIDDVYIQVHRIIRSIIFSDNLYIALYDKESNWLSFPYCIDEAVDYRPRPFARGYSELVISTERSQLVNSARSQQLIQQGVVIRVADDGQKPASSWMGAPLKTANGVIGLIACQAYDGQYEFTHEDLELISFISNQIASVLQTHLANQALKQSHQQLEQRVADKTKALQQSNLHLQMQIEERKKVEKQLYHDAHHDPLTGLPNRSLFLTQLEKTLNKHQRHPDYNFSVLFIDLDKFKDINDELGHQAGDQFLIWVSKVFSECIRDHDLLARLAGDEFVILLDHLSDKQQAEDVAKRIIKVMQQPFAMKGQTVYSGASIGITYSDKRYQHIDEIIRDADAAMYYAKNAGKGRYEFYHPLLTACSTSNKADTEQHNLCSLSSHFRLTDVVDFSNHRAKLQLLEVFGEHPILGSTSFDVLKKFTAEKSELVDLEFSLLKKALLLSETHQQELLFCCSTVLLESDNFSHLCQLLKQHSHNVCLLFSEEELRFVSAIQLQSLETLTQMGLVLGLTDFGKDRCDLSLISKIDFSYLLLSSTFSKRVLQQTCYEAQLQGVLAVTKIRQCTVIAKGPAILNFRTLLENHGLQLFLGKQVHYDKKSVGSNLLKRSSKPLSL
jgi:diguanylate cyclase (GGDEF)-like protein